MQKTSQVACKLARPAAIEQRHIRPRPGQLQPPRKPQPSVQEWLVLHERGVIEGVELLQQLGLGEPHGSNGS
ncbi:MAG: hypothetical protein ACK5GZ_12085 [Cyanobium sp.]|jgi:hypothetical protein